MSAGKGEAGHTATPWAYRPQEHDDWGVIRTTVVNAEGWHPVVAVARYVGNPTDEDLGEHRRNKSDPSEANAAFIVRACNSHDALVAALKQADDAIREMFRYFDGGETRGSYDGKPERDQLRKAGYATRAALAQATSL